MIDYLLIGHVTQDLTPAGPLMGGTASYSAITAQRLGKRVGVVTRASPDFNVEGRLPGIEVHCVPDAQTTTYENVYQGNNRTQWIRATAGPLTLDDVPPAWRGAPIVHLAPLTQEFPPSLALSFPRARVGATPQGWLRQWDEAGRVGYKPLPDPLKHLRGIDALIFSAEDVAHDPAAMRALIRAVPLAVITQAQEGAVVHTINGPRPLPARPAQIVDPTGAGDVFAAAFLVRLGETDDPFEAAAFANVVASFSIEGQGISAIPTRETVEAWLAAHR